MGSLMAGWDSNVPHPNVVKFRRNKSLTKDEIEAFWKSKKQTEDEHLRDISLLSPRTQKKIIFEDVIESREEGSTVPLRTVEKGPLELHRNTSLDKNGWWISSNWAFLNEPPVLEATTHKYRSQFHVADMAGSKTSHGPAGVNA